MINKFVIFWDSSWKFGIAMRMMCVYNTDMNAFSEKRYIAESSGANMVLLVAGNFLLHGVKKDSRG